MEYMPGIIEDVRRWNTYKELLQMEYMPGPIKDVRRWNLC